MTQETEQARRPEPATFLGYFALGLPLKDYEAYLQTFVGKVTDADLHAVARRRAAQLSDPDKKHLRFNEIVDAAKAVYPPPHVEGVIELVDSCNRSDSLYVKEMPMWLSVLWIGKSLAQGGHEK
jgi:hypothetical protein